MDHDPEIACGACGKKFVEGDHVMTQLIPERHVGNEVSAAYSRAIHPECVGADPEQIARGIDRGLIAIVRG